MTTPRRTVLTASLLLLALAGCSSSGSTSGSSPDSTSGSSAESVAGAPPVAVERAAEPGPLADDTFVDHGVSGPVDPAADPASTFALDVDTGSYSVARSLLADGLRPPTASIRAEEWVNSFRYDDEPPADAALGVSAETGLDPASSDDQLVRVAVTSRPLDEDDRPRAHVTLVVDRSGSMDLQERLGLVKASLGVLADRLRDDDDTVAVVSFDDAATPILPPTPVGDTETVLAAIDELRPGGSTNLEAGLALGYEQARASYEPGALNVVVLCSDGVANVGATMPESITGRIAEEGARGIHLVTVGYGMGNYNDHLMEQLADLGDGFYSYVDTFDEAERLFGTDLTTTLVPVAAEARAQVRFDPELVASYRLVGYENRALADDEFADLSVDAGELGPGHHATALYAVRLAPGVSPGTPIGVAELRWIDVLSGAPSSAAAPLRSATSAAPSPSFELASLVADTALALKTDAPLDPLAARASSLASRDVPGAAEVLTLLREASFAAQ